MGYVLIEVRGGVAYVIEHSRYTDVYVRDLDNGDIPFTPWEIKEISSKGKKKEKK